MKIEDAVILSKDLRNLLDMKDHDQLDIILHNGELRIKKSIPGCIFCNSAIDLVKIGDYAVCEQCITRLSSANKGDCLYPLDVE